MTGTTDDAPAPEATGIQDAGPDDQRAALAERYGTARRSPSHRFWWIFALSCVAVGAAIVTVLSLRLPSSNIEFSAPRYVSTSATEVDVTITVTMAPGATARCAVQVLGDGQSTVGWRYVDIAASTEYTQTVTVPVRSVQKPIAASVPSCWLTES